MRSDEEALGKEIAGSKAWDRRDPIFRKVLHIIEGPDGEKVGRAHPFSAHERNAFFMNGGWGRSFHKLSGLSGADSPLDSRGFALLDFDRDGDQDLALINANAPSFQLYRTKTPTRGNYLAIRLTGGGHRMSNRDAIGSRVSVETESGRILMRALNAGEGYGIQNSKTLIVGLGEEEIVRRITVFWASGKVFRSDPPVKAGQIVHFTESEDDMNRVVSDY